MSNIIFKRKVTAWAKTGRRPTVTVEKYSNNEVSFSFSNRPSRHIFTSLNDLLNYVPQLKDAEDMLSILKALCKDIDLKQEEEDEDNKGNLVFEDFRAIWRKIVWEWSHIVQGCVEDHDPKWSRYSWYIDYPRKGYPETFFHDLFVVLFRKLISYGEDEDLTFMFGAFINHIQAEEIIEENKDTIFNIIMANRKVFTEILVAGEERDRWRNPLLRCKSKDIAFSLHLVRAILFNQLVEDKVKYFEKYLQPEDYYFLCMIKDNVDKKLIKKALKSRASFCHVIFWKYVIENPAFPAEYMYKDVIESLQYYKIEDIEDIIKKLINKLSLKELADEEISYLISIIKGTWFVDVLREQGIDTTRILKEEGFTESGYKKYVYALDLESGALKEAGLLPRNILTDIFITHKSDGVKSTNYFTDEAFDVVASKLYKLFGENWDLPLAHYIAYTPSLPKFYELPADFKINKDFIQKLSLNLEYLKKHVPEKFKSNCKNFIKGLVVLLDQQELKVLKKAVSQSKDTGQIEKAYNESREIIKSIEANM